MPREAIAWVGRHGTMISAAALPFGILFQDVAALVRPWLAPTVTVLLMFALLLVRPAAMRAAMSRPLPLVAGAAAMAIGTPAAMALLHPWLEPLIGPGLMLGLFIFAFAPPTLSSAAYAALLGLDSAVALALCLGLTLVCPIAIPLVAGLLGIDFPVDSFGLAARLAVIVGCAVAATAAIRGLVGPARIAAERDVVAGLLVIPLSMFAIGAMDGMASRLAAEPARMAAMVLGAFALSLGALAAITAAAWAFGRRTALAIGWCGGNRNFGLLIGAFSNVVPDDTWAFFAVIQLPIYSLPALALMVEHLLRARLGKP